MSFNSTPQILVHRVRCAVMLPESNPELRAAGASNHECQTPPEFYMETRVAGISVRIYVCSFHKSKINGALAQRRIAARRAAKKADQS